MLSCAASGALESKEICADHVIIYGSYDRCKRPNQWMSSCFHFKCIIYNSAALYMHIVLNNQWVGLMSCCAPPCNENVEREDGLCFCPIIKCYVVFPWLSGMCITALHLSHCEHLHFIFSSPLVISISGICLMVWDSLVNRSHDKQPIFAQSLDYVFREQCISTQQYVISACVELRWQLWAFNKNSIKNYAVHSAEGRAAKSQLKHIQIHLCACLSSHHENTIMFSHCILWLRITTQPDRKI